MKQGKNYIQSALLAAPIMFSAYACTPSQTGSPSLPNVVFILADDIGPGDIAVYHRERTGQNEIVPTRHIDQLAGNGIRFSQATTPTALCAPTRYSIMTGCNAYRSYAPFGVWSSFAASPVEKGQKTVGNVMQDAGYQTAFFGKYHLGGKANKPEGGTGYPGSELWDDGWDYSRFIDDYPNTKGFDYSYQTPQGVQNIPFCFYENGVWDPISEESAIQISKNPWEGKETNAKGEYIKGDSNWETSIVGPRLAKKAVEFINNHVKTRKDSPFFIYYCSQAVHVPHEPPLDFYGTPVKGIAPNSHMDMIYELDLQVGMIVDALKKAGVYNNTLIIFTSDNGGLDRPETRATGHISSYGLRGSKGSVYEGGTRVPFIAQWPGVIPKGKVSGERIMAHDLMATLYAVTGQYMPGDQAKDSYNILPIMKGEADAKGRDLMLYQGGGAALTNRKLIIREGDWKLIIHLGGSDFIVGEPFAFFNLEDNPLEEEDRNLVNNPEYQERMNQMLERYKEIRASGVRTTEQVSAGNGNI